MDFSAFGLAMPESTRLERLAPPKEKIRVVLDTDTYNEIDDQFAVAYSILSPEKIELEAIYAAPFFNERSEGPKDGMEKSYEEILRLLDILGQKSEGRVFRGSTGYLRSLTEPQESEAVDDLIARAMEKQDRPLYVVAIGAITNIASAIIREPRIAERIILLWLGGNALYWPDNVIAFNLAQDVPSSRVVFDSGVPLIHFPCLPVISHLLTTRSEMERYVKGKGAIGDYLYSIFDEFAPPEAGYSKVIWDISTIAYLLNADWMESEIVHSPIITDQKTWSVDHTRHFIRNVTYINRDAVFKDLFARLESGRK